MINLEKVKEYCREDISKIQNYEQAVNDETQVWHCHHRLGIAISIKKMKELGCYYKRPACELIFLTESQHRHVHGINARVETRAKLSNAHKGEKHPMFGKHHTEEAKKKMSEAHKGRTPWMKGKHHTEEAKKKMSESKKGQTAWNKGMKGVQTAWNKGKKNCFSEEAKKKISESKKGQFAGVNNPASRPVLQIDIKTGNIIKIWDYIKQAADTLKINRVGIVHCCRGKSNSSGGYIWRYAD